MKKVIRLRAAISGELRTAVFEGRDHVVVPVVALVEGVIHASNSEDPELVLSEEFGKAPQGWNGRPVVGDHPSLSGTRVSANEPEVLESKAFGRVFHAQVRGTKLMMEAWLDPAMAKKVGPEAEDVIARVREGKGVEVSVGVFVVNEETPGSWTDGSRYAAIWREIIPDHLAMLPEGTLGACSIEMGCGAPRAAEKKEEPVTVKKSLMERLKDLAAHFRPSQAEDQSDEDLRRSLGDALNSTEPAFLGIDAVFSEAKQVVYAVAPEGVMQLFRREFTQDEEGTVELGSSREEVKQVTRFEPVTAQQNITAASCGCGGKKAITPAEEAVKMDKKARVAALLALAGAHLTYKNIFKAADAPALELLPDERLTELEAQVAVPAVEVVVPPVVEKKQDEPVELTQEEKRAAFFREFPDVAATVAKDKAATAQRKAELVKGLKAATAKAYSEAELDAMGVPALEKLLIVAQAAVPARSFEGAAPRAASAEETVPPAPDMNARIRAARGLDKTA